MQTEFYSAMGYGTAHAGKPLENTIDNIIYGNCEPCKKYDILFKGLGTE